MSRQSLPITPVSSPLRPTRSSRTPQEDVTPPPQAPVPLCKFDEHMMSLVPTYKPMNEDQLRHFLFLSGATEDTMDQCLQAYNRRMEHKIQRGGFRVIGVKPLPDDSHVYNIPIPDSPHALRMWAGGMDYWGQFCLDFFDVRRNVPVNLPAGYALHLAAMTMPPGVGLGYPLPGHLARANVEVAPKSDPLRSWERNMGMDSIPDGEEKWSLPEGTYLTLKRDGHPDFTFQMPTRQPVIAAAQPRMGFPRYHY